MDQNQLQALDPKLREAYQRVMGTNATPKAGPPPETPVSTPTAPQPSIPVAQPSQPEVKPPVEAPATPSQPVVQAPPPPPSPVSAETMQQVLQQQIPTQQPPPPSAASEKAYFNQAAANTQMQAYVADEVAGVKQSLQMIQLLYIAGGIIFFVVYALFWMKFFNVAAPF